MANVKDYNGSQNPPSPYTVPQGAQGTPASSTASALTTLCFAASDLFGESLYSGFGTLIESYIAFELTPYLARYKVAPFDLYIDPSFEGKSYLGFLKLKNPGLPSGSDSILSGRRPDILIHNSLLKEYYEIKPNSRSGRYAGGKKLTELAQIYARFGLPYSLGVHFYPPSRIEIGSTVINYSGKLIPVSISFGLTKVGALILYDICITTNWELVLAANLIEQLLRAMIDLLRQAFARSREFIERTGEAIAESGGLIALALGTIALLIVCVLLSEIAVPAVVIAAILVFFKPAVSNKAPHGST